MFKLILQNPFFTFAAQSANLSKYVIKNNAYLIEAPLKRPVASYALYLSDKIKGTKGPAAAKNEEISKEWNLNKEIQDKYNQLAKEKSAGYAEKKKQY